MPRSSTAVVGAVAAPRAGAEVAVPPAETTAAEAAAEPSAAPGRLAGPAGPDVELAAHGAPFAELTPSAPSAAAFVEVPVLRKTLGVPERWYCFGRRPECARWAPVAYVEWSRLLLIR
jgi:hypothetical protein